MSTHAPDPFSSAASGWRPGGETFPGQERRERRRAPWPFYTSGYVSCFLAGTLDDGSEFGLVAGVHGRHFPYFHPRSRWDDLLLAAGGRRVLGAGRRLPPLSLVLGSRGSALVAYHGLAAAAGGTLVDVDLNLALRATLLPPRMEGPGHGRLLVGLRWQPALVAGAGTLSIDGRRHAIHAVSGEMERGSLRNLRASVFRFAYEYTGLTRAGTDAAAHVRFRVRPLRRGVAGWPLRALLGLGGSAEDLTLSGDGARPGDPLDLAADADRAEVVVEGVTDLGPARLVRQLVRVAAPDRPRWGLRESFLARR